MHNQTNNFTNLVEMLEQSVALYPDKPLFGTRKSDDWQWLTYREFGEQVIDLSEKLARSGLRAGDALAIISGNRVEWAVATHATMRLGATFVPLYEQQSIADWQHILQDCQAKILLISTPEILGKIMLLINDLPQLKEVALIDSYMRNLGGKKPRSLSSQPVTYPAADDLACIIYTSGTTGQPKGVRLSHGNIVSNIQAMRNMFPLNNTDRSLAFLPWAHSFGLTLELHTLTSVGASMAICDDLTRLVEYLGEVRPTALYAVPRIFNKLYASINQQIAQKPRLIRWLFQTALCGAKRSRQGGQATALERVALWLTDRLIFSKVRRRLGGRLKYAATGSAALAKEIAEFIDLLGIDIYEGYGLSETSPMATCNWPGNHRLGSVGRPIEDVRIVIEPTADSSRDDGEIIIYGPNVMLGYHNLPEETARALTPDGGFRSGDLGKFDKDGFLFITGRIKEQYKLQNGRYVVPAPLEEVLKLSPFIANVMIFGDGQAYNVALVVPDQTMLSAWLEEQRKSTGSRSGNEADWCQEKLTEEIARCSADFRGYEHVRRFKILTEDFTQENGLLTPTLKLRRQRVLDRYQDTIDQLYR
ncbi:long-chain fatty acid--CoA ligase [Patescibacteria group bacterium]|nr:long-chain fatty acid--CoA ligase [Patescibacteria group bacterium]